MTLEGVTKNEGALEGILETIKDKGALGFKGGLRHAKEIGVVVILKLESSESKGLQACSRGDPFDDVKDGGYIVEFDTNNRGGNNLGF
jgi:hypothetical protein